MMLRVAKVLLLTLLLAGVTACAVRYGPRIPGIQPGYVEERLGEQTYQVKIGEAWPKDFPDLEKFAIFRAAEIIRSRGQRYFAVLNATTQVRTYEIASPTVANTTATANTVGNTTFISATTTTTPASTSTISGGWYTLDFRVLTPSEIQNHPRVVDSERVISDLRYFIDGRR
jgi:hypothetical protein